MLPLPVFVAFDFGFGVEEGLRSKEWMSDRAKEPSERKGRGEKDEADLDFEEILTTSKRNEQKISRKTGEGRDSRRFSPVVRVP